MPQYQLSKSNIKKLSSEQIELIKKHWTPEIGQKIVLEPSYRSYTIKRIEDGKFDVGSFYVDKSRVLPKTLSESILIHLLAKCCFYNIGNYKDDNGPYWMVSIDKGYDAWEFRGDTLVDALWEAFKVMVLE